MPKEKRTDGTRNDPEESRSDARRGGGMRFVGIVLIAAALFNIPKIVVPPATTEDRMMLVVLGAMILAGLMLVGLPALLNYLNMRRK